VSDAERERQKTGRGQRVVDVRREVGQRPVQPEQARERHAQEEMRPVQGDAADEGPEGDRRGVPGRRVALGAQPLVQILEPRAPPPA